MKPDNPPKPDYAFAFRTPPRSGNEVNGLGDPDRRRARHVFHNATGEPLPYDALDNFFDYINPRPVVRHMFANTWQLRRQDGPVDPKQTPVTDPLAMATEIKAIAKRLGAELVGITTITEQDVFEQQRMPFNISRGRNGRGEVRQISGSAGGLQSGVVFHLVGQREQIESPTLLIEVNHRCENVTMYAIVEVVGRDDRHHIDE